MYDNNHFIKNSRAQYIKLRFFSYFIFIIVLQLSLNLWAEPICESIFISDLKESRKSLSRLQQNSRIYFDQIEFKELHEIVVHLLNHYPSSEYEYLAIGRSPTPIVALLELKLGQEVRQIPISAFRNHKNKNIVTLSMGMYFQFQNRLTELSWKNLFFHFTRFLPHPQKLKTKKILLIDFVFTGVSILSVKSYIEKYYQHLGKSPLVEIFGVTSSNSVVNADFAQQMELWQLTDNSNLEFRFEKQMFEEYAKVDSFDVHQSSNYKMKVGDNYEKFKKSVNLQLNVFELDQTIGQELKQ